MRALLKNINMGGLYALGLMALTLVSWKAVESSSTLEWYRVNDTGTEDADKEIVGTFPNGQPDEDCLLESGSMCAVPIDRKDYTGTINDLEHAYQLQALGQITVGTPVYKNL